MKTRPEFLLVLLLFITPHAHAQKFTNVEHDVTLGLSAKYDDFGNLGVVFSRVENNLKPVVGPVKPPNVVPLGFCTITGFVANDRSAYGTKVGLHRDNGSRSLVLTKRVFLGRYRFENVPEGRYLVIPKGRYPSGQGREGGLGPDPGSQRVICQPNGVHNANFKIHSWEG